MKNPYPDFDFSQTKDCLLVAVDLSNEFTSGCLGTKHAQEILPWAAWFIENFEGDKVATLDTHGEDYLDTQEGRLLPIVHGQIGTYGWQLADQISNALGRNVTIYTKNTFGSEALFEYISHHKFANGRKYKKIYFIGACTGICVIANAILAKTADPEAQIIIMSQLCSCVTKETHETALKAMSLLQMAIM